MSEWGMPKDHEPKKNDFAPVPAGNYSAIVDGVKTDKTAKGTDFIDITLKITSEEQRGRLVWAKYYYTKEAIKVLWDMLCELEMPDLAEDAGSLLESPKARGRLLELPVHIYVKHEEYNGKTYAKASIQGLSTKQQSDTDAYTAKSDEEVPF